MISPVTRLDTSDRVIPTEAPKLCAAWTTYNSQRKRYSGGFSEGYGPVVAYPAKRLQAQCHENRTQQLDGGYACDLVAGLPVISNFWSTNAADETTDEALSRLLVDVRVLDDINQTVTIGKLAVEHCQLRHHLYSQIAVIH